MGVLDGINEKLAAGGEFREFDFVVFLENFLVSFFLEDGHYQIFVAGIGVVIVLDVPDKFLLGAAELAIEADQIL